MLYPIELQARLQEKCARPGSRLRCGMIDLRQAVRSFSAQVMKNYAKLAQNSTMWAKGNLEKSCRGDYALRCFEDLESL